MRSDIVGGVERLRYFAGLGYELQGKSIPATAGNIHFTVREPYGVVGRILAFNHPINFAIVGMASPLMAGNTVILKPSEQSPLSASLLAEIASEILPPGVLTILSGGADVGAALVRHPRVKRLSFVGSARTGMAIQRAAAEVAVKHVSLELGGKNPFIAFADAPVDRGRLPDHARLVDGDTEDEQRLELQRLHFFRQLGGKRGHCVSLRLFRQSLDAAGANKKGGPKAALSQSLW